MVPPETLGLGKFWPNLKISEAFLMGLEVWFAGGFCIRESLNVFADGVLESRISLFSFCLVFRSQTFQSLCGHSLKKLS